MKLTTADEDASKSVTGLADAISGLDKEVVNEVILEAVTPDQKDRDPDLMQLKLEVLQQQNELIEEEKQQRESEVAKMEAVKAEKAEKEKADQEKTKKEVAEKAAELQIESDVADKGVAPKSVQAEKIISAEEFVTSTISSNDDTAETKPVTEAVEEREDEKVDAGEFAEEEENKSLSTEEIDAISELVSPDPVSVERVQLESIKAALQESDDEGQEKKEEGATIEDKVSEQPTAEAEADKGTTVMTSSSEVPTETVTVDNADKIAEEQISAMDEQAKVESEASTQMSMDGKLEEETTEEAPEEEPAEEDYTDKKLDKAVTRLKSKVESMVGNLEIQISDVEAKIGDKLHFLDKDMDGILSREEMALCLQSVLKRPLSFDEAMAIAADMDENEDGFFSVEELSKWLETNKIVKLVEEGRDAQVDKLIAAQAAKMNEQNQKKDEE